MNKKIFLIAGGAAALIAATYAGLRQKRNWKTGPMMHK